MESQNQTSNSTVQGEDMKLDADNSIEVVDGVRVANKAQNGVLSVEFTQEALLTKFSEDPKEAKEQSEQRLKSLLDELDQLPSAEEINDMIIRNKL